MDQKDHKHRILIGDDSPFFREIVADVARGAGVEVDAAGTGKEIIEKVAAFRPDLLVLDHQLPDMSGTDVLRAIGAGGGSRRPVVLAMSGASADSGTESEMRRAGAAAFMNKKFTPVELLDCITRLLEARCSDSGV